MWPVCTWVYHSIRTASGPIPLGRACQVVRLQRRELVLPESYPRFTLVLQAIGSARLALEGLRQVVPEVPPSPPPLSLLIPPRTYPLSVRSIRGRYVDAD